MVSAQDPKIRRRCSSLTACSPTLVPTNTMNLFISMSSPPFLFLTLHPHLLCSGLAIPCACSLADLNWVACCSPDCVSLFNSAPFLVISLLLAEYVDCYPTLLSNIDVQSSRKSVLVCVDLPLHLDIISHHFASFVALLLERDGVYG